MEKMDWDVIAAKVRAVSIKERKPVRLLADTSGVSRNLMKPAQNEDMGRKAGATSTKCLMLVNSSLEVKVGSRQAVSVIQTVH
ncbi:hypothetical protein PPTG_22866 [Phytophthora nicotianae INRA-310]|uniref:Uncharacterized protein n=1 Tax=Phytophthora nicotianae (strain INRA-310) TaxID=761204 RepID=W2Q854_PHYN3|nr:hypothetical protein PPTG_22866 [Phytophthora nicotianae INRA-310]ETN09327.1 hypothetical protein PPTG_22866 [Phytophthora nicotianae INRA-310]